LVSSEIAGYYVAGPGKWIDIRKSIQGWQESVFDDSSWEMLPRCTGAAVRSRREGEVMSRHIAGEEQSGDRPQFPRAHRISIGAGHLRH